MKTEAEVPEVVKPEVSLVKGTTLDLWKEGDSIFTDVLSADMKLEERQLAVRDVLQKAQIVGDRLYLIQGEMLYEVMKNAYWVSWKFLDEDNGKKRAYNSFDEFALLECGMKKSKARHLVDIYEKFVVNLKLPVKVLRDLEWTKARELLNFITKDNWKEHVDKIKSMSVRQVKVYVLDMKGKGGIRKGSKGELEDDFEDDFNEVGEESTEIKKSKSRKSGATNEIFEEITFSLSLEQLEMVNLALNLAGRISRSESRGNQLHLVCTDFVTTAGKGSDDDTLIRLDVILKHLEQTFGVKLVVADFDQERFENLEDATKDEIEIDV